MAKLMQAVGSATLPPCPGSSAALGSTGAGTSRVNPNKYLEPEKLSRYFNTVEFKSWCRKTKALYTRSNFAAAPIQEQQGYLRMVLDVHLENKVIL